MEIEKSAFQRQVDDLMAREKQARLINDNQESAKILKQIVQLAYDLKEYQSLFQLISALSKKRGQSKKAQVEMVQLCITWIKDINDQGLKLELISTLKDVSDKKIFLEVEYARCCLMIVKLKEDEEQINEAAKILQEVQVETYGSMDRREKLEFILYQMKIMIKKKDYVRLIIISRKINPKNLNDKEIFDLKLLYYSYLVEYYNHEEMYLECAKSYLQIFETLHKNPDFAKTCPQKIDFNFDISYNNILENFVLYLSLTRNTPEQQDLLINTKKNYEHTLEKHPNLLLLIDNLLKKELITSEIADYKVENIKLFTSPVENNQNHVKQLRKQLIQVNNRLKFLKKKLLKKYTDSNNTCLFFQRNFFLPFEYKILIFHQHNIMIIQRYYQKISMNRFAALLKINASEAEDQLCEMINEKYVKCKIDRVDGTINFLLKRSENEVLNEWSFDINKVLLLVDNTTNLIKREEEINAAKG